jgi:hypothetical protein
VKRGYELIAALEDEANDVAREDRAQLMRDAARYIEELIRENRELVERLGNIEQGGNL